MGKFCKGSHVRILGEDMGHHHELIGAIGTIEGMDFLHGIAAVEVPGARNLKSSHKVFHFREDRLELLNAKQTNINDEEYTMTNYSSVVSISVIRGTWSEVFCACYEPDIALDDCCVISTPGNGYEIGYVTAVKSPEEVELTPAGGIRGEVVCKIDDAAYKARVEQRRQAKELKEKMRERAKKLQDLVLYETLAKSDPEMQQLLDQFKELNGF